MTAVLHLPVLLNLRIYERFISCPFYSRTAPVSMKPVRYYKEGKTDGIVEMEGS